MNLFRWLLQPDPRGSYYSAWDLLDNAPPSGECPKCERPTDCAECLRQQMEGDRG